VTQPVTDWLLYRKCPVCQCGTGTPCRSASGAIVNGQPDGKRTSLEHPHKARRRRSVPKVARQN